MHASAHIKKPLKTSITPFSLVNLSLPHKITNRQETPVNALFSDRNGSEPAVYPPLIHDIPKVPSVWFMSGSWTTYLLHNHFKNLRLVRHVSWLSVYNCCMFVVTRFIPALSTFLHQLFLSTSAWLHLPIDSKTKTKLGSSCYSGAPTGVFSPLEVIPRPTRTTISKAFSTMQLTLSRS